MPSVRDDLDLRGAVARPLVHSFLHAVPVWRAVAANTIFVNFEELPDDLSNMYRVFRLPFLEILKFEVHHGLIMFSSMLVGAAQADSRGFGLEFTKGWFTGAGSPACEYLGSMCDEVPLVVD